MQKCYFCNITTQISTDIVYQDDKVLVIVADDWVIKGHTFIVWKQHVVNISDITEDEYSYFSKFVYRTEKALLKILEKNKSIILKSGGIVPHFHFHIYPIMDTTPWQEIKDMFDMKVKYQVKRKEKEEFLNLLRAELK